MECENDMANKLRINLSMNGFDDINIETNCVITECGHKFHRGCIEAWFRTQGDFSSPGRTRRVTCPLDRKIVKAYYPLSTEGGRRRKTRKTRKSKKSRNIRKTRK